jgi:trehalose synthase
LAPEISTREVTSSVQSAPIGRLSLERFRDVLSAERWRAVEGGVERARRVLAGRVVWNVNSTARGGGVAEMLRSLLGYARDVGIDTRWMTISADASFFAITKRLHNRLHGSDGDGGPLGDGERSDYEEPLRDCARALRELIAPDDVVVLHDPQTAGLVPLLRPTGARIAWRSHVGYDGPGELALEAWRFLLAYVRDADVAIFSRPSYAWGGIERERLSFIHPSIDAFSTKNQQLDAGAVRSILTAAGVLDGVAAEPPTFVRADGTPVQITRTVELVEDSRLAPDTPCVLQVSRWDRLKDPLGVIDGFATGALADGEAHLVLAGPATSAVADDPEGPDVLAEVQRAWRELDARVRARVHLACIPMDDADENALIVNALQRHATIVCQKSIAEGFGLTVAEAMWKARPVVASGVGGILDQIEDGVSGVLVHDPRDLRAFARAVSRLLGEPSAAAQIGAEAHRRAREEYLGPEHLLQYLALFERLLR